MAALYFSTAALADLKEIDDYTFRQWGEAQAIRYAAQLFTCCDRVAQNPRLGRQCEEILPGLRRIEQGKHVIFYQQLDTGLFIWRVLHQSMLPTIHKIKE